MGEGELGGGEMEQKGKKRERAHGHKQCGDCGGWGGHGREYGGLMVM